jgi:uroporphyrinogen decarboxylase
VKFANVNTPSRRRFCDALAGRIPDRVPYFDTEFGVSHVRAVLGQEAAGTTAELDATRYAEFAREVGVDALCYSWIWPVGRVYRPDSTGRLQYVDGSIKSARDFGQITGPDVDAACRRLEALARAAEAADLALVLSMSPPYKLAKTAVGYEDFLLNAADNEAFLLELTQRLTDRLMPAVERLLGFPLDAFLCPGDLCCKSGPMLSPESIARLWTPSTTRFLQPFHDRGVPVIIHMDGDFHPILDTILSVRPAALHPFEHAGELDIFAVKQTIGDRVTLMGNVDLGGVLSFGTPGEVREAVRELIARAAPGGRYVCGSSHEVSDAVPVANFRAMVEAVHEFGEYGGDERGKGGK